MTTELIEVSTVMMSADEARLAVASFRDYMASADHYIDRCRTTLLDLHQREGWRALGYQTWRACAVAELNLSQAQAYRLLGAAEIERDIMPALLASGFSHDENLPEAVLRPLLQLDSPEERQAAALVAIDAAGGATPSSAQMRRAVEQVQPAQTCGHPITVSSVKIDGILYCPSCASQLMTAQNERAAAEHRAALAPVPIIRADDDGALFDRAWESSSISDGYLDKGKIKRPFQYDGKLWISVGGGYGGIYQSYDECTCVRVVLDGEPYSPGAQHPHFRAGSYTGDRASAGGKNYVLTGQWLVIRRMHAPSVPKDDRPFWRSMSAAHPTAHYWTKTGMYSYRSACGMTAQREPAGAADAGQCSSCARSLATAAAASSTGAEVPSPIEIPIDIAAMASAYALTIDAAPDGLLLYWPDEIEQLDQMQHLSPDLIREWLQTEAPRQVAQRAVSLGWDLRTRDRGQTLVYYHRLADGKETAEYSDAALAAGDALRLDRQEAHGHKRCACGAPAVDVENIGGMRAWRCVACKFTDESTDLREQMGEQYLGYEDVSHLGNTFHMIKWAHGGGGYYSYIDALAMLASKSTQLRMLTAACERAEQLGATVDYMQRGGDGKVKVIPPAGYQNTPLWCSARELAILCDSWAARTNGAAPAAQVYRELPESGDAEALDIWIMLGDLLINDPAVLLGAARAALDRVADSPALDTESYEQISKRIGQAQRAIADAEAIAR
jgi:hypothetical protein